MSKTIDTWGEEGTTYSIIEDDMGHLTIALDPPLIYTGNIDDDSHFRSWNSEMNNLLNSKLLARIKCLKSLLET